MTTRREKKKCIYDKVHSFITQAKFSEKLIFFTVSPDTNTYVYQGVRNINFPKNIAFALHE